MAMMCEVCKCSAYYNDELDMYSCENGCACCNDPDYESDWDAHTRIMKQIREYVKLTHLSLSQDSDEIQKQMDDEKDLESDEYRQLEIQDIYLNGKIIATDHILKYLNELELVNV
jgi:hypothetical protein